MLSLDIPGKTQTGGSFSSYFNNLFTKKRKLVKLELDFIDRVKTEWQTILGNNSTDRATAESTIKACYQYAGLQVPHIIWAEHPLNVIKVLMSRPDLRNVSGIITNEIWNQSELIIQQTIDPDSTATVLANITPSHLVNTPDGSRQVNGIADRLNELVLAKITDLYLDLTDANLPHPLQDYRIGDLSYFDYFYRIGVNLPIQLPIELAKSCGWCWTFEQIVILTPKPTKINIDPQGNILAIIYDDLNILGETSMF